MWEIKTKILEANIKEYLYNRVEQYFLNRTHKALTIKGNIGNWTTLNSRTNFQKNAIKIIKRQFTECKNLFTICKWIKDWYPECLKNSD